MTDPIADMLTQIRNAQLSKKPEVAVPYSALKQNLAALFQKQGFLSGVEVLSAEGGEPKRKFLKLQLKYAPSGRALITGLKRVSRPGQRIYARVTEIPRWRAGLGSVILSTSKGLMTDQEAREQKVGGEIICQIW